MSILSFFVLWLSAVIVISFFKLKWAVSLYLIYTILVPYIDLGLPWLSNWFIIFIMIVNLYKSGLRRIDVNSIRPFMPFVILFVGSLVLMIFQEYVPFDWMTIRWRRNFIGTIVFPIIIWEIMKIDPSSVKLFRNTILLCIIISIGYGLILTRLGGINPYIIFLLQFIDYEQDMESYYEASNGGRLFGRISSVFVHPMSFAFFIGLSLIYLSYIKKNKGKVFYFLLICATVLMSILCGIRSVIGGLVVAFAYLLYKNRNYKVLITTFFAILFLFIIILSFPDLSCI